MRTIFGGVRRLNEWIAMRTAAGVYGDTALVVVALSALFVGALIVVALAYSLAASAADNPKRQLNFDHLTTGFPLTGAHLTARCENCHLNGVLRGTPRQCGACHIAGSRLASTSKPPRHIPTNAPCEACHRTVAWKPAFFRHQGVTPGTCASCHNGSMAAGKPARHMVTSSSCDSCHRTAAWLPAMFSHANVAPGTCASCHNGTTATGKPANHIATTASCDTCHRTTAWIPATFSHASVAPGTCASCHNGVNAQGMGSGHFITTRSCDACHNTTAWTPVLVYSHISPVYRPHNAGITCNQCHKSNSEVVVWPYAAYKPDCAGCHASRFKPDSHKKTESPQILYTVSELRNCSGSCHLYTDSTFTVIKKARSGEHRSTDGGF
jgi:hypothetical protein